MPGERRVKLSYDELMAALPEPPLPSPDDSHYRDAKRGYRAAIDDVAVVFAEAQAEPEVPVHVVKALTSCSVRHEDHVPCPDCIKDRVENLIARRIALDIYDDTSHADKVGGVAERIMLDLYEAGLIVGKSYEDFKAWWALSNEEAFPSLDSYVVNENFGEESVMFTAFNDCWNAAKT